MSHLHYLTVQDILWVNLQATKKVHHFNYAKLEEATFYQYAYGESSSLVPQAGRFLTGFLRMAPFKQPIDSSNDAGNESTALIACAAFLKINGMKLDISDEGALDWLDGVMTKQKTGVEAVSSVAVADTCHHEALKPDIRSAVLSVVEAFPRTIASLAHRSATAK